MDLHERLSPAGPARRSRTATAPTDPFSELKNNVHLLVISDLGPQLFNVASTRRRCASACSPTSAGT